MNLFIVLLSILYAFEFIGIFAIIGGAITKVEVNAKELIPLYGIHLLLMYAGGFFDQVHLPQYIILGLTAWGIIDGIRLHDTTITKFNPPAMLFFWFVKVIAIYQGLP
jgi:hypothetical protein